MLATSLLLSCIGLVAGCSGEGSEHQPAGSVDAGQDARGSADPSDAAGAADGTEPDIASEVDGSAAPPDTGAPDPDNTDVENPRPGTPDAQDPPDVSEEIDTAEPTEYEDVDPVGRWQSYFNKPTAANNYHDNTLRDRLVTYLNGAVAGSEVRAHITQLSTADNIRPVVDAIINAHNRGVKIWMVNDGGANVLPELVQLLGNRYVRCGTPSVPNNSGCLSNVENGTHHMKNWYFSHTRVGGDDYKWMVVASSYNITVTQARYFNDMLVVSGNQALYDAHIEVYDDYLHQRKTDDRYSQPHGKIFVPSAATYSAQFSPQKSGDMIADALSRITRFEEGCSLGVGTLNLTRSAIFNQLERIKELGCEVRVVTGTPLTDSNKARLDAAGIPHRNIKTTKNGHEVSLHSKMMVYRGYYETPIAQHPRENRGWVWAGSQNFTMTPLRYRDDVFVGISRGGVTNNYSDYYEVMWANGR